MSIAHRVSGAEGRRAAACRASARPAGQRVRVVVGVISAVAALAAAFVVYRAYGSLVPGVEERAYANAGRLLDVERRIGLAWEAAAQRSVLGTGVVGAALTAFYALAYWPFVVVGAVTTLVRDRVAFRLLRNALLISGAVGLVMILLAPVAPPRLVGGFDDQVADLGLGPLAHPSSLFNPYAAVPSFHVGWTTLVAAGVASTLDRRAGRVVVGAVPAVMSVAVVTTGNHYVLDVVAGLALAVVSRALAPVMERGLDRHRARVAEERARRRGGQSRPRLHMASRS
jgi:hypothetical protein